MVGLGADRWAGVMAARGLMVNPALFSGAVKTPWGAVERFLEYAMLYPVPFRLAQHHVNEMLDGMVTKRERAVMYDSATTIVEMLDWLDERFVVRRSGDEGFGQGVEIERRVPAVGRGD